MSDFLNAVAEVTELANMGRNAAKHASVAAARAEAAVVTMVAVAILIVVALATAARELNLKNTTGRDAAMPVIVTLVFLTTIIFTLLTIVVARMADAAAGATDAATAATRAVIGMEVVEKTVVAAIARAAVQEAVNTDNRV